MGSKTSDVGLDAAKEASLAMIIKRYHVMRKYYFVVVV